MSKDSSFFITITADVLYDKELSPIEKLIFAEISSLTNKQGFCFASNKHFASIFDRNETTISTIINKLSKKGYISIEIDVKAGNERKIFLSYASKIKRPIVKNQKTSFEKSKDPSFEKSKDSNTYTSNTYSNTNSNNKNIQKEKEFNTLFKAYKQTEVTDKTKQSKGYQDLLKRYIKESTNADFKDIAEGTVSYLKYCKQNNRYLKDFKTFINQRTWEGDNGVPWKEKIPNNIFEQQKQHNELKQNQELRQTDIDFDSIDDSEIDF